MLADLFSFNVFLCVEFEKSGNQESAGMTRQFREEAGFPKFRAMNWK